MAFGVYLRFAADVMRLSALEPTRIGHACQHITVLLHDGSWSPVKPRRSQTVSALTKRNSKCSSSRPTHI
jgi:hypothetical protein